MENSKKVTFVAIDLFCGCGGLSLGLRRAGFKVVSAVDNDSLSVATYRKNHRSTYLIEKDIQSVTPRALMNQLNLNPGDLDLLAGCPPCQGFSQLRTFNGGRCVNEPMNDLVFEFMRFVKYFEPKTIMMENVPGLLADSRMEKIKKELDFLHYKYNSDIFNAWDYGVPQRRNRMILMGARETCPPFAPPVNRRLTVSGAIQKLPAPEYSDDPTHNYIVRRTERVNSIIRRIPKDGGSRNDLPIEDQLVCHQNFEGFRDIYGRMAWRRPAPTITGGCINPSKGRYLHPEENRAITVREASRLQGFPRTYKFDMSRGRHAAALLVGNAFPPKFAEHHARSIYRYLTETVRSGNVRF